MHSDGDYKNIGQQIILPSSYAGGCWYMDQRTSDAMAYIRIFGRAELFLTFTSDPNWPEISNELFQNQ